MDIPMMEACSLPGFFPAAVRALSGRLFGEQVYRPGVVTFIEGLCNERDDITPSEDDPDLRMVMAAQNGDNEAFESIVRKYQGKAFNIALRMLSDREEARDLTQEVFIKIYRSLRSFRSESRFSHWFYTVLLNTCRSRLKHLKRRRFFSSESMDNPGTEENDRPARQWPDQSPDASSLLEKKQIEEIIQQKMKDVPETFRDVLILRDIQGFAYEEISSVLGINIGTIKSRLHRGRTVLKDLLAKDIERLI